ncbi:ubiquitin-conjugating enzyme E2 R1-like [Diadema setosum]|uniref:ubiquitin-conjugating enzyme E2 R1-like n=1 Tax=Diadema setosum TaxID=31175 RepID=UPI003B3AF7F4
MATTTSVTATGALRALQAELVKLEKEPVEGFIVKANDENLFVWEVAIFGPPGTLYEGGYFKAVMTFPQDYPYSPPTFKFLTKMWHPNIYETSGDVCISILHPPVADEQSGELPSERWNPTQNVRTILLSVISLLNEPNTYSPANVDASVMYRRWKDSKGKNNDYAELIMKQVRATEKEAQKDKVVVPTTLEEYCIKTKETPQSQSSVDLADFYDEDYAEDDDDEDDDDCYYDDDENDSGNGES